MTKPCLLYGLIIIFHVVVPYICREVLSTEKKTLSLMNVDKVTFFVFFNLIFDFKKLHTVFLCVFFIFENRIGKSVKNAF